MPMPHEMKHHERAPHEMILEKLEIIEKMLEELKDKGI